MQEIWKDIKNYEGLYQISNLGRIKSLKRYSCSGFFVKERILKQSKTRLGYLYVDLSKEGKSKKHLIHRFVAETFIPNPKNYPCVNHIDGNKQNNHIDNLEWCSYRDNEIHAYKNNLKKLSKSCYPKKEIIQYDLNMNKIKEWDSISSICKELGISCGNISSVCLGKRKTAKGFVWRYKNQKND